jgi:hypothetical protein
VGLLQDDGGAGAGGIRMNVSPGGPSETLPWESRPFS